VSQSCGDGEVSGIASDPGPTPAGSCGWSARGLLFENFNCTAVCPGHVHFSQPFNHEVCHGFRAVRVREGRAGGVFCLCLGCCRALMGLALWLHR